MKSQQDALTSPIATGPAYLELKDEETHRKAAFDSASTTLWRSSLSSHAIQFVRHLCFASGTPIYHTSKQRALDFHDLFELETENATATCYDKFHRSYKNHNNSITKAMLLTYGKTFALCGFGYAYVAAAAVFAPVVVHHVVSAFDNRDGLDYADLTTWLSVFFLSRLLNVIVATQVEYSINHIALRITGAMKSLLFRKALRRDAVRAALQPIGDGKQAPKPAEISNLISSDTNGVLYAILAAHNAWVLPTQVIVITYLLFQQLDVAAFAGLGVVLASLSLNYLIARVMGDAYGKLMKAKDLRMATVKEVFGAIQIVKFNAWEPRFHTTLTDQRAVEVKRLSVYSYASAASSFVLWSSPFFVSTASFAVYALAMGRTLTAAKVFTSMALFNALRDPLRDLPTTIQSLIQSRVSIQRLNSFLSSADLDTSRVTRRSATTSGPAVQINDATFQWGDASPVLDRVELRIEQGDFCVVHGAVGAGKSSLLSGILGELTIQRGSVAVNGRVAYYSQQPWIQNMTIRDNILFGTAFNPARYDAVLDACCLRQDLALFPAGDATEIGEKGVNLSGGQRARVALARACYADADLYLLDSPLAAVDSLVQKKIFEQCLCGLLRSKTIILVTHNPDILASPAVNCRVSLHGRGIERVDRTAPVSDRSTASTSNQDDATSPTTKTETPSPEIVAAGVLVQDEERQEGQISGAVWQRYLRAVGGWNMLILLLFAQLAWQGFQIGSDFWLSHWTSVVRLQDHTEVSYFTGVYAALAASGAAMVLLRGVVVAVMGLRAAVFLFRKMTDGLLHAPIRFFDANPIGRIINRYADDMAAVDVAIPTTCSTLLSALFSTVAALITAAVTIQYLGLLVLPIVYLYVRIAQGYVRTFCDVRRMLKVVNSPILSHITQSEAGAALLRAFGDEYVERAVDENHKRIDVDNALWDTEIVLIQWFALRLQLLGCGIVALVVGSFVAFADWFSPGIVGLAFTYALSIDGSLLTLMKAWSKAENAMVSVERVVEYSALPREGETSSLLRIEPPAAWPVDGAIAFDRVCFAYKPGDAPVLHDVSFSIHRHEKVGIVGRTGAGKSSLAMALLRMNELDGGAIRIDGVDIASVPLPALRSRIAIIPQSPVLLAGSLRHFLDPFDDYEDAQVLAMLAKVELLPSLEAMASDTTRSTETMDQRVLQLPLQANGDNLSVGERQLLCLARALLRQCAIVVMDEATAAMDHRTEATLARMLASELQNVTQLTIAHRLATVLDSDRILVMDQGRVVEFGSPQRLLADEESAFSALMRATASGQGELQN